MQLRGQHGYAMAALLVGMSVAAILMTAAMPAWKQMTRREREAELVFRGEQYARAIGLFQKKSGPGVLPPSIDVLVSGHYLRKKFKDPITNDDFDVLAPMLAAGGAPGAGGAQASGGAAQSGNQAGGRGSAPSGQGYIATPQSGSAGAVGGIVGVASKSKDASLRVYNGRTHYNEWQFIYVPQTTPTAPGAAPGGPGGQPQRGGQSPSGIGGVGGQGRGQGRGQGPAQGRGQPPGGPNTGGRGAAPIQPIGPSGSPFAPRR